MAKRKTKKVVDLAPKPESITKTQLNKVQSTVRTMDQLVMELGKLTLQKHGLLKAVENVQNELDVLRNEFKKDYGTDNINVEDGTIKYPDNGETDKKD
jgi:FtsZ-binding cell division protein ZapB|tara:strand:- start:413 stop:706 length:294 start_codon:yes stop_codon:yes gene_type:complete